MPLLCTAFQLNKEIAKAVKDFFQSQYKIEGNLQLISEDYSPKTVEYVHTALDMSPPEGSELANFILQR